MSGTMLPGMKLGCNLKTGTSNIMRSWKNFDDPSHGEFTFSLDPPETPQLILRQGETKKYRWGPFDGDRFSGSNELRNNTVFKPIFVSTSDEVYYAYETLDDSTLVRSVVTPLGSIQYLTWRNTSRDWNMIVELNRIYYSIAENKRRKRIRVAIGISISTAFLLVLLAMAWQMMKRVKRRAEEDTVSMPIEESQDEDLELPIFGLATIVDATDQFAFGNKIGQGGFGPVYKGKLPNGSEIAVKRLSQDSGQGLREFQNEVKLIANLQHRNLVKLLGCCIQGEEKMLVYEYLPNKSLDNFIFDRVKRKLLPWNTRFDIVLGIARGLLYLHQDSRLRIIHRDLKTSNILLDIKMNPKISDFGTARIFGGEQTEEKTRRVIGTYGYMSPEYAMSGHFSIKSDVFSFGVIVLELISGRKNWGFYDPGHDYNLIGHTWKLWNEDRCLELVDEMLDGSFSIKEVIRCIQVALLCVQQRAEDRPAMSTVVFMLSNENVELPQPKEPGFITENSPFKNDPSWSGQDSNTGNELTITAVEGR
ncbi:unnamed protein product [Coffea canephora]|uniref:non-specific serine/threonine protein kinase n=1 Tax=Coffea canephora TaxID=49390 RepID=A0A068TWH2_COFCA|nr:unnamed protein product [Coffea canephora]